MSSMFEDDYSIPPLGSSYIFPNPRYSADEGLLAFGGDLSPNRILTAYRKGIFPWFSEDDPILWWSPNPRMVLYPEEFKVNKSFKRFLRQERYKIKFDNAFEDVINYCSSVERDGQNGTWLLDDMKNAYIELYKMGFAHSIEVYEDDVLVGGLYGLSMGRVFFGESMFSLKSNASKVAFKALSDVLNSRGYDFIDCQVKNDYLAQMGAKNISRDRFLDELEESLSRSSELGSWKDFKWEYKL
ncbi:Leucyl/phenylalanyl-tRNA--protein transferase [hydrothermal vent metagenome]|uniref:Leucyl/phenylalanyl-tRNA--protein transferase n=1 Tax=hydrothermal vent metagenome TaxID=652676 RepID=A0A1W1BLQ3_9ZZZZ